MGQPPRRKTMEVDISWLEEVPGKKKKPPRMPGAAVTVPPLPVDPPRNTIPVKDEWIEVVDDEEEQKKNDPSADE